MPQQKTTHYTCQITPQQTQQLQQHLTQNNYQIHQPPHTHFAAHQNNTHITAYTNGKLLIQGKHTQHFIQNTLQPKILKNTTNQNPTNQTNQTNPDTDQTTPRIGIDESGKGDYFGPLCIAAIYVNQTILKDLAHIGITDSKNITNDKRLTQIAQHIIRHPTVLHTTITIGNPTYNRLHKQMKSINRILAWAHARAIQNLTQQTHKMNPPPQHAISDQFAHNKNLLQNALHQQNQHIKLIQRHKAETDPAVAAASILARHQYLKQLQNLQQQHNQTLPKGAGKPVDQTLQTILQQNKQHQLPNIAKLHFRNTNRALGKPEPPPYNHQHHKPKKQPQT